MEQRLVIAFLRLFTQVLRIIKPAFMEFLIVLAVLMIRYLLLDPHGTTVRAVLVFCMIVIFALLGGLLTPPSRR
jgi:hypothetical protein